MLICCLPADPPESTKRIQAASSGLGGKGRRSDPVRANSVADIVGIELNNSIAPMAVVPPNLADLPKHTFRIMVSADCDKLGGHPRHPGHQSWTRLLRRHEHADP